MVLGEDHILITNLYYFKGYGAKRLISEFPAKGWKKTTVNDFLKRLKETGSTTRKTRKSGSGRSRTVRTVANINAVNDLVLSQEDAPQTHRTTWQIAREMGIYHSSVVRVIRDELRLKCVKKRHAQELTEANWSPVWVARKSCWVNFQKVPSISSSLKMRRYLQLHRLWTSRTTVFTRRVGRRSTTLPPTVCFALSRRSASLSWCLSWSQNLDALNWSLWSREWW